MTYRHPSSGGFFPVYVQMSKQQHNNFFLVHLCLHFLYAFLSLYFLTHIFCHLLLRHYQWIAISPLLLSKTFCCMLPTEKLYSVANNKTNNKDSGMANNKTNTKESGRDLASVAMPPVPVVFVMYSCFTADFGCLACREEVHHTAWLKLGMGVC